MTLFDVCDYIVQTGIVDADHVYSGKLDAKKQNSIGAYNLKRSGKAHIPIGGLPQRSYDVKPVSILIHWSKNQNETEKVAQRLYDVLMATGRTEVGECVILFCRMLVPCPQDVGTDDSGIFESVIEVEFYTERKD